MRVEDAARLQKGDRLLCKRIGEETFRPPILILFERCLPKHRKYPARAWAIRPAFTSYYIAVNVRDLELEDPLQRIANML
jgi:hypothetical protein